MGRSHVIREAIDVFDENYNQNEKIQVATVTSACEMTEDILLQIAKKVQEYAKCKSVKIKPVFDKSIIGGFIVDLGDKRIDLSLTGKLKELEKSMDIEKGLGDIVKDDPSL